MNEGIELPDGGIKLNLQLPQYLADALDEYAQEKGYATMGDAAAALVEKYLKDEGYMVAPTPERLNREYLPPVTPKEKADLAVEFIEKGLREEGYLPEVENETKDPLK